MSSKNDSRIMLLKEKIAEKKNKLKKLKFTPVTNCSIEFEGTRHNLQVLKEDHLTLLLIKLNSYLLSMKDLNIESLNISGYDIKEWISDIKLKLEVISLKDEELSLKALQSKLEKLLSDDKKTELELDSIQDLLK